VHHGLGDLADAGHQTVDQDEDQQETHSLAMLAGTRGPGQGITGWHPRSPSWS
jgi:hypothetical protein